MNYTRFITIASHEFRTLTRSPLFWIQIVLVTLISLSLNPTAMIPSSETAGSSDTSLFNNSRYAIAQFFSLSGFFIYTFFLSILAGLSVIRDDEANISALLNSTPLTSQEYLWGKFTGILAAIGLLLALHITIHMLNMQFGSIDDPALTRGPFQPGNYIIPALLFAAPGMILCAGLAFAAGEWTRKPMAVYAVPTVLFIVTIQYFFNTPQDSIPVFLNQLLLIGDPSGVRWLMQSVFEIDRGSSFYNSAPLTMDAMFVMNRILIITLPLLAVTGAVWHHRKTAVQGKRQRSWMFWRKNTTDQTTQNDAQSFLQVKTLGMSSHTPSFFASLWHITRIEAYILLRQPVLYLLILFTIGMVMEMATEAGSGPFGARAILSSGSMAVATIAIASFLICLLLLFYAVESYQREKSTQFESILYASPFRTGALLLGKSLALFFICAAVLLVLSLFIIANLMGQQDASTELMPLFIIYGLLMMPTFFFWNAFIVAITAIVRNRYAIYGVCLMVLGFSSYQHFQGNMTWLTNWDLWGALRWSEIGLFELNLIPLIYNRLFILSLAVLFFAIAVTVFARTERDATANVRRRSISAQMRYGFRLMPYMLLPVLLGGFISLQIHNGFQGDAVKQKAKRYWRTNFATWHDFEPPAISYIDLDIELAPDQRQMTLSGAYRLVNHTINPMQALPFTISTSFGEVDWTLNGNDVQSDDRYGLHVLTPATPLLPGDSITVGYAYTAVYPDGFTRNGGGMPHFILPSGVLLSTYRGDFLPRPGFDPTRGVDQENYFEPETTEDPAPVSLPFNTYVKVRAPSDYTVNAVGRKTQEVTQDGYTTVTWESDYPVRVLNVMAGKWDVRQEGQTAVYFHPKHGYNTETMLHTLVTARDKYSEWFYPYPWQDLRINEFPNLETNATAFPTNISFSESIGFLTRADDEHNLVSIVTAHEAAHQWWGHLLSPKESPGVDMLIEGMANYSALLLQEDLYGSEARINFALLLEEQYVQQRRVDREQPLTEDNGNDVSGEAITNNKGAWVMWMLHRQLGPQIMFSGLQSFISTNLNDTSGAGINDLLESLRPFAQDSVAYQSFIDQWFFDVVLPEFKLSQTTIEATATGWEVTTLIENMGTGKVEVEVAAMQGERFSKEASSAYQEARIAVSLSAGENQVINWSLDFKPDRLVTDPDAQVLQLNRAAAEVEVN